MKMSGRCIHEDVLTTTAFIADDPNGDEQAIVERLVAQGYEVLRAELLVVFVPLGLGRAVIAQLQLQCDPPIYLSDTALIRDFARNRYLEIILADVPEFVTAFELGEETFLTGCIPREQFSVACGISVEMKLINEALFAGKSLSGGEMAPPILMRLADKPGFEEWYCGVKPKNIFQRAISKIKSLL